MYGVIGGSGFESIMKLEDVVDIRTPYGSVTLYTGKLESVDIAFLPRHGVRHEYPPHKVNYRANIYSFYKLGVERIVGLNAVGGIKRYMQPGDIVVPHDYVDFTKCRRYTFYDGPKVVHIDVSQPYCPELRRSILEAASEVCPERLWDKGVYVATEGARYETPAEIAMFASLGFDVVGMTGCPEATLARELGLCYATICLVTNRAAGLQDRLTTKEVLATAKTCIPYIARIVELTFIRYLPRERGCRCKEALVEAEF
ncbi:MAG: S-methyl-5'-thioinosine phosphorylase [Nitrososphaerota archaeon]|nr:S-methyl-5'-thioinosine phosphorylase [Candidatus Bathyarchaeota archaeon]MDW8061769.1 S-methyl-5'-thioinosine phosphorylase [Nitrososphaerota archaeon]